jgi:hypothetical protein
MTAAYSTVEALMYQLRSGTNALANLDAQRRLSELDEQQLREVVIRLQKFGSAVAESWKSKDIEILIAIKGKLS